MGCRRCAGDLYRECLICRARRQLAAKDAEIAALKAERDAAIEIMHRSNANALRAQHNATDGDERWAREQARIAKERDHALAACAEMRAALELAAYRLEVADGAFTQHWACDFGRFAIEAAAARALLARTDLGAGWASPEVVAQMVGALQMVEGDGEFDSLHEVTRKFVVDVLALLKKGGG